MSFISQQQPGFNGQLGNQLVGQWRARVVNNCDIPGPYTSFEVDQQTIVEGLQECIGINGVSIKTDCENHNEIKIEWEINNQISGIHYEVERRSDNGLRTVIDVGENIEWTDREVTVPANSVVTFNYRVRAVLGDLRCKWQPTDGSLCQVTIDRTKLRVGDRVQDRKSRANGIVAALRKGKKLGTSMVKVNFDDQWIREIPADDLRILE